MSTNFKAHASGSLSTISSSKGNLGHIPSMTSEDQAMCACSVRFTKACHFHFLQCMYKNQKPLSNRILTPFSAQMQRCTWALHKSSGVRVNKKLFEQKCSLRAKPHQHMCLAASDVWHKSQHEVSIALNRVIVTLLDSLSFPESKHYTRQVFLQMEPHLSLTFRPHIHFFNWASSCACVKESGQQSLSWIVTHSTKNAKNKLLQMSKFVHNYWAFSN